MSTRRWKILKRGNSTRLRQQAHYPSPMLCIRQKKDVWRQRANWEQTENKQNFWRGFQKLFISISQRKKTSGQECNYPQSAMNTLPLSNNLTLLTSRNCFVWLSTTPPPPPPFHPTSDPSIALHFSLNWLSFLRPSRPSYRCFLHATESSAWRDGKKGDVK